MIERCFGPVLAQSCRNGLWYLGMRCFIDIHQEESLAVTNLIISINLISI